MAPALGAPFAERTLAAVSLESIVNEATLLQRMCDGQAANIRKMSAELESLRRMSDLQAATIARKTEAIANLTGVIDRKEKEAAAAKSFYNVSVIEFARICREAEFGRKMAAVAGVNIV